VKLLRFVQTVFLAIGVCCASATAQASVDSYRYLHVNIDTPWAIFVFLFFLVFAPMILAVILHWWHATKKDEDDDE